MAGLNVDRLTKRFGKKSAVEELSFQVAPGEIVGLLGPNGAGKSTTFMCLAGLLRPDGGTIEYDGKPLGSKRGRVISLIPESPEVYAMLTVWEHLVFVSKSCKLPNGWERDGSELLRGLGIEDQRDTLGQALSKGMRQKTLIAATMLANAPVMLFDEPMVGLDPLGQREFRRVIAALHDRGTAVMISTHMLESAQELCDRVVIMKDGRAITAGRIDELQRLDGTGQSLEDLFLELTR